LYEGPATHPQKNKLKNLNIQNPDGLKGTENGDNTIQDIRQMNIKNLTACVQDPVKLKNVVEKAKTFNKGS
jgi:hypothetical protein